VCASSIGVAVAVAGLAWARSCLPDSLVWPWALLVQAELAAVLALGVPTSRIIFAHPCKRASDIRYAREHGIQYTTFDSESELNKLAAGYPSVGCVLRIRYVPRS